MKRRASSSNRSRFETNRRRVGSMGSSAALWNNVPNIGSSTARRLSQGARTATMRTASSLGRSALSGLAGTAASAGGPLASAAASMAAEGVMNWLSSGGGPATGRIRNVNSGRAKLAGRIPGKNKVLKYSKRNKKVNKKLTNGIVYTDESYNTITAGWNNKCIFLGHSTLPSYTFKEMLCWAIIKKLATLIDAVVDQPNELLTATNDNCLAVGDTFTIRYRSSPNEAISQSTVLTVGAANTWSDLKTQLSVVLNNIYANVVTGAFRYPELIDFTYAPDGAAKYTDYKRLNLVRGTFDVDVVSTLKIQNRSTSVAADNEADNVNNVPLIGRSYDTEGTGFTFKADNRFGVVGNKFLPDTQTGVIQYNAAYNTTTGAPILQEPPEPGEFYSITKSGGCKFDPGDVKYSTIVTKKRYAIQTIMPIVMDDRQQLLSSKTKYRFGNSRLYAIEKVIEVPDNGDNTPGITLTYEHNRKMMVSFTSKKVRKNTASFLTVQGFAS